MAGGTFTKAYDKECCMQEKKSLDRKGQPPLEDTPVAREVMDSNRARVLYQRNELKPLRVIYSDGAVSEFRYDSGDRLEGITERNGIVWSRITPQDNNGYCQWRSTDGQDCLIRFAVLPDGTYQRQDPSGIIETVTTGFKRYVARPFAATFDAVGTLAELFEQIDKNRDRTLTRTELDNALAELCANREHVGLVAMLRHYFEDIIRTRDDPMLIEAGGLTVEDLKRFEKQKVAEQKKLAAPPVHLNVFFEEFFSTIDTDTDGMTCLEEVEQMCLILDPRLAVNQSSSDQILSPGPPVIRSDLFREHLAKMTGSDTEGLLSAADSSSSSSTTSGPIGAESSDSRLVETTTDPGPTIDNNNSKTTAPQNQAFSGWSIAGIIYHFTSTQQDLKQFEIHDRQDWIYKKNFLALCEQACLAYAHALMIKGGWYYDEQKSAANIPRNIFADPSTPSDSIRVEAVRQGSLGDPVFLATLAGVVAANPPAIARALKQNAGKTCTVTFPGAPSAAVTMSWLTALELSLFQPNTEYGIWCAFMQKAYETHLALMNLPRSMAPSNSDETLTATNIPFELLANRKAGWRFFKHTHEQEVRETIMAHHQQRLPVLVSTAPLECWIGGVRIHPSHVMAIVRLNKETGTALLRDPLASVARRSPGAEQHDGATLTVSIDQLLKHFLAISVLQ